jgi:isoquinoline 1-oxidoreductase beta subunit
MNTRPSVLSALPPEDVLAALRAARAAAVTTNFGSYDAEEALRTPRWKRAFRGLAQTMGFGSYVAACAEVSVNNEGELKVHRIVAATDPGYAVNPQQIEAQVEGSFSYGLSAALFGECTQKDGRMEQDNFSTYPVVQMQHMPAVETIIVASGGFWGGVGEPTIAVAAPAVLNAVFAATGKRIRDLPLKNHSLKKA